MRVSCLGGLMSYGPQLGDLFHRAAALVGKILPRARHSSSSRPHSLKPSAVCGTVRMPTFVPCSSTTHTACI